MIKPMKLLDGITRACRSAGGYMTKLIRFAFLVAAALSSGGALATPVTFEFVMPAWTENFEPSLFGTTSVLDVTLDNGSTSTLSQSYRNNQIISVTLAAVGGPFRQTFVSADLGTYGALSYISTNATGVATLDLLASSPTSDYHFGTVDFGLQFAIIDPIFGGPTPFAVADLTNIFNTLTAVIAPVDARLHETGFAVQGHMVPEPLPLFLLSIGLAGVAFERRARRHRPS